MASPDPKFEVAPPVAPVMVRVEDISKNFGNVRAIEHVSFEIRQGEVLGFLGPNGAGKTTAMRILTGFFPPTQGRVWIGEIELFKKPKEAKRHIGYMPESVSLYGDMKVLEFLGFVARIKNVPRGKRAAHIEEKLQRCGVGEVKNRLIGQLSKGYRQRIGLAQALIGDPGVLILDEPTNGLDPKQIVEVRSLIRELGKERTLILSTHILPEVSMVCDRVLIMNRGSVVASGTTEELEAGLKKAHEIFVVMGDRCRKEEALDILRSISGIDRITVTEEKNDQVSFSMVISRNEDLRPVISRLFVERKLPLLEIRSGRLSLEEIFMKIVLDEKSGRDF